MNNKQKSGSSLLIRDCLRGQKLLILLGCVLNALSSVCFVALAWFSKGILDIATGVKNGSFTLYIVALCAVVIIQIALTAFASHFATVASGKMGIYLKNRLFKALGRKKYSEVYPFHSGDLLNRFIADGDVVVQGCTNLPATVVSIVIKLISGAVALILLDWRFGGGIVVIGIIIPFLAKTLSGHFKSLHKQYQKTNGLIKSFLQEIFKNLSVVKTFASKRPVENKLFSLMKNNYNIAIKRNYLAIFTSCGLYLFFTAGYFLAIIWGATGIKSATVTYGELMAFLQIISQLRSPMQSISSIMPSYYTMIASSERICEICELEDEYSPMNESMLSAVKDVFSSINCNSVSFSYGQNEPVLTDCSFSVNRGEIVVISGESGGGKSTLFRLMLGYFDPTKGNISFDNKYEINASTRALFSYVPQGNMILSGSIKENITLCATGLSEDEISKAIDTAVLSEWIDSLPDGINTKIGENGLGISEGQAQRIAVARALLCNTPILLLDEATSALDSETEIKLLSNIKKLQDKTVFLVTHRSFASTICDRHLHLQNCSFKEINN